MKHTVVHLEIPAEDVERAKAFYTTLFGWQFSNPPGVEDYWVFETGESGKDLAGGMMQRQDPSQVGLVNYVNVGSVDEFVAKAQELGGQVIFPKMAVPGMGWFVHCTDTEGNVFALWEDDESAA